MDSTTADSPAKTEKLTIKQLISLSSVVHMVMCGSIRTVQRRPQNELRVQRHERVITLGIQEKNVQTRGNFRHIGKWSIQP